MVDKIEEKKKFSSEFKEIKFNKNFSLVDEKYENLMGIVEEAILDDDTPEWKRKLALAVDKEIFPQDSRKI